ncbi:PAS domain-containing protein [Fulvivirgaceae bacterium PWU5]|uniref:histidine kinase n=1 Tax=Dawidia cretensis TaxID=2782350 RepID=A0AAP2DUY4_9BACT|nr:PAS domain-containing protein [Dawidia cretensis]MBT1707920.1 PAS domain-containing protein [Dawidia cretensis]
MGLADSTHQTLKLIIKGSLLTLAGSWQSGLYTSSLARNAGRTMDTYDYLIRINDVSYLLHPDDRNRIQEMVDGHQAGAADFDFRIIDGLGHLGWVHGYGQFVDQQEVEEGLRHSEQRFRIMADTVPQILWITDGDGHVEFFNNQWTLYTGAPPPATAGDVAADFLHPEDGKPTLEAFMRASKTHTTFRVEHRIKAADGTYRWFDVRAEPHIDARTGKIKRWYGASVDITEKKQAQQQLQEFNSRLERQVEERMHAIREQAHFIVSVAETIPDMLSVRNLSTGAMEYVNHAPFTANGYDSEKLRRMTSSQRRAMVHPDDLKAVSDYFHGFHEMSDEDISNVEYRSENEKGEWLWFNARGKVFKRDVHGRATHSVSVVQNISAMKKSETARIQSQEALVKANDSLLQKNRELKAMNGELNNFAFIASHDLREPLRKIQLFANLLVSKEGDQLSEKGKEHAKTIVASAARMNALIEDVLSFSKINTGVPGKPVDVDLNEILQTVLDDLQPVIQEKNAIVRFDALPKIKAYSVQLIQLFQNLVSNGIKFQPEGQIPHIGITAAYVSGQDIGLDSAVKDFEYLRITVEDDGIGFHQEYADKIFDMFQRLHDHREYPGTGMGLAICRKVLKNHGGFMTAAGKPGQGASFFCFFPVADSD